MQVTNSQITQQIDDDLYVAERRLKEFLIQRVRIGVSELERDSISLDLEQTKLEATVECSKKEQAVWKDRDPFAGRRPPWLQQQADKQQWKTDYVERQRQE